MPAEIEKRSADASSVTVAPNRVSTLARRRVVQATVGIVGVASSLVALYQFLGWKAALATASAGMVLAAWGLLGRKRRSMKLEARLLGELPADLTFLVEFLRSTYRLPERHLLMERNRGLVVHSYENNFIVSGMDCKNAQHIRGRNVSTVPSRGLAFALVGGSSVSAASLASSYAVDDGSWHRPEFIVDNDRFKVAFCSFGTPLLPQQEFDVIYADEWNGSMRETADGFFFPEALYFPEGIQQLASRVDFVMRVESVAVLEVDIAESNVRICAAQPVVVLAPPGMTTSFSWSVSAPSRDVIYVLYYRAIA